MPARDHDHPTVPPQGIARFGVPLLSVLLGLMLLLAGLGEWGFGDRGAHGQTASDRPLERVFGPRAYELTTSEPRLFKDEFTVPNPTAEFSLVVENGNNGAHRASGAAIAINDQVILGPWQLNPQVEVIRQAVRLQAQNRIFVEVRGDAGALLAVSIVQPPLNTLPVADAGGDRTVALGERVALDGSGSSDADGDPLSFRWRLIAQPATSTAALSDSSAVRPALTVDAPGSYSVELVVTDSAEGMGGRSRAGEDSVPATATLSTVHSAPVAKAGPDQRVALGATVGLDGGGSTDGDGDPLTYRWTLDTRPPGSQATLANPTSRTPSFTVDRAGSYIVALVVSDGTADSAPDYVVATTGNARPVAEVGPDRAGRVGGAVALDGGASHDADGDALSYAWALAVKPAGSAATLTPRDQAQTTFTPDIAGDYVAQLIVDDGAVASVPDTVLIAVAPPNRPPEIISTPVTAATATQPYSYAVVATDPDPGDTLTYTLPTQPDGMTINAITGLLQWTPTASQVGGHSVRARVTDRGALFDEQAFTIAVAAAPPPNQAPQVDAGADQTITLPTDQVALNATVTDDGLPNPPAQVTLTWSQDSGPGTVTFGNASAEDTTATFSAAGTYVLKLTANDGDKSAFDTVTITVNPAVILPPDPATVAPPVDPTVATTTFAATEFLYTGANPIQTGVAPGTIDPKRAAVLRGKVLDRQNNPLPAVVVTVLNHPEFGQTLSRADGEFDLAVNGGGLLTVVYNRGGYLPVQRQANVPWQDYVVLEDVVLITRDVQATLVDLTNSTEIQVARGSQVSDQSGTRQATLLIPPGTQAQVYNPDGTTRSVPSLTLRASEFTVGANGPKAMPGPLPANVAYTYALELSADEATIKKDGVEVLFNQPVPFYVDNFLNFPAGIDAPVGYYDTDRGAWIPESKRTGYPNSQYYQWPRRS